MKEKSSLILFLAIFGYTAWSAKDIVEAWVKAPLERYSFFIFLIWLIPIFLSFLNKGQKDPSLRFHPMLLSASLVFGFFGQIASFNAICYLGLACVLSSVIPFRVSGIPWLISSLAWMPVFGWFESRYFSGDLLWLRALLVLLGVALWCLFENRARKIK